MKNKENMTKSNKQNISPVNIPKEMEISEMLAKKFQNNCLKEVQ